MITFYLIILNISLAALNAGFFAAEGHAPNAGVAVFCALIALVLAIQGDDA